MTVVSAAAPSIAFGTAKLGSDTVQVVYEAIKVGYRHLDTAEYYGNEALVGLAVARAISEGIVTRSDLFITSKVYTESIVSDRVEHSLMQSLSNLQIEYMDMYLIHWPVPRGMHVHAWKNLVALRNKGLIKLIGVSNYAIEDVEELRINNLELPYCNQIEVSPLLLRKKTIQYMQSVGILVFGYRILGKGGNQILTNETILSVANKHSISPAQAIIAWCLAIGVAVIVHSRNQERMESNLKTFDWILDHTDIAAMSKLTSEEGYKRFADTYRACTVRDTGMDPILDTRQVLTEL